MNNVSDSKKKMRAITLDDLICFSTCPCLQSFIQFFKWESLMFFLCV